MDGVCIYTIYRKPKKYVKLLPQTESGDIS